MAVFDTGYEMGVGVDEAATIACRQIDVAVQQYPSALGLQCHIDPFAFGGEKQTMASVWFDRVLSYAAAHHVAIVSAEQWLAFTEMRHSATMRDLTWNDAEGVLTFEAEAGGTAQHHLLLLLPLEHRQRTLRQVVIDGMPTSALCRQVGGVTYGAVTLTPGHHQVRAYYG